MDYEHMPAIIKKMSDHVRNHIVAAFGEFLGTMMFLTFGLTGAQVALTLPSSYNSGPDAVQLLYISLAFAMSLTVNVWVFYRVSGGQFNPAVTLGLVMSGAIPASRGIALLPAQLLGGIAASLITKFIFPGGFSVQTALAPGTSLAQGVMIEAFLTFQLVFTVLMLAVEKHRATFLAPLGIGASLFIAELSGVKYTGGSLNPARSFGPDLVMLKFAPEHWIYWVGPVVGAIVASLCHRSVVVLGYESANPGQDSDGSKSTQKGAENWTDEGDHAAGNDEEGGRITLS